MTAKSPTIGVQQEQEPQELETPDSVSDTFPSTVPPTIPPPLIQSGSDDSPQVTEHSNSHSSPLLESSHIGNTGYRYPLVQLEESLDNNMTLTLKPRLNTYC